MQVRISSEVLAAIRAHAAEASDREVCGLLFGEPAHVLASARTPNVALDPAGHFEIDPAALIAALRAERSGGPTLLGYYHSHPHGTAEPSAVDQACSAQDGKLWLIVAGDQVGAWRAEPGSFSAVRIIAT